MKFFTNLAVIISGMVALSGATLAHVTVKPAEVAAGAFQTFTIGVPVEKDIPTIAVRLVIPGGLEHVTPTVKPGWTITIEKKSEAVTEINWTGGQVPAGQRDEFSFSAQAPAKTTTLAWKAYQTSADGSVVAWDQKPEEAGHDNKAGKDSAPEPTPYSQTKVVEDTEDVDHGNSSDSSKDLPLYLSGLALVVAVLAYFKRRA